MVKTRPASVTQTQTRLRENLRFLMARAKDAGRLQGDIAIAAGMHPSYLSLMLRGRRSITLDTIEALAPHLGATAETILQQTLSQIASVPHAPDDPRLAALRAVARVLFPAPTDADARALDELARALPRHPAAASDPVAATPARPPSTTRRAARRA